MKTAVFAAIVLISCGPRQATPDSGITPEPDAGTVEKDAGRDVPDAGKPDAGPVDAGTLGWKRVLQTPPSRSTHRAFWWAPTHDTRVLSGNHASGPIQDFWRWSGSGTWTPTPMSEDECPERKNAAVALDDVHQRLYVFGGTWSGYPRDGGAYTVKVLGDFRSWDGTTWRDETPDAGAPSARGGAAMGYDSERKQLVLFGGSDNLTTSGETWVNAGQQWELRTFAAGLAPSPRLNMHLVFDAARKKLVMFGGQVPNAQGRAVNLSDTWEWDGQAWADKSGTGPVPPGRGHAAMAYDPVRQKVVMMGGARDFSPIPPLSTLADFWEWDGTQWKQVTFTGKQPGPRTAASLSFDVDRSRLILYGGYEEQRDLSDLWELDGTVWTNRSVLPLPRSAAAFAQKGVNDEALMFGGYMAAGGSLLRDTWRWKEGKWSPISGAGPDARSDAAMAFHGAIALLVGGQGASGTFFADNWAMGPGSDDWVMVAGPTPRGQAAMAHDPKRGRTVVFGGRNAAGRLSDTWVFDGTSWRQVMPATVPEARKDAVMLFDPTREQLVLFGGSRTGGGPIDDAWAYDGTDWKKIPAMTAAPTPRVWQAMAYDSLGKLWAFGGYDGTAVLDDAARFENGAWVKVGQPAPPARFGAKLLAAGNDRWQLHFGSTSDFKNDWFDFGDVWELGLH